MLVLTGAEIETLLDLDALIDALAPAMADLSAGHASVPQRVAALTPDGLLGAMPGYVPSSGMLMSKLVTLFPGNVALPTHQAVILAFDPKTGAPTALLDGTSITALRTAAGSALSTRLLARPDAETLAILGTGVQARSHARAVSRVRPIRRIRIASRDPARAKALAAELATTLPTEPAESYQDALAGADIVCATTHASEPVVRREWLHPGAHVTSVGYNPTGRELDDATVAEALVCVESRSAVLAPFPAGSNDLLEPIRDGLITAEHIHAELGELVLGVKPGRTTPDQLTVYKSVGVAVQDAAATALVLAAARGRGVGREIVL
jgi:ornithine cyclodeaminase/alanine dehydrogenase-like protein (mu-crystallin family)